MRKRTRQFLWQGQAMPGAYTRQQGVRANQAQAELDALFGASLEDSTPLDELDEARAKLEKLFGPEREKE